MLRMTRAVTDGIETVVLEGKLLSPWVDALRAEVESATNEQCPIRVSLEALTFVDAEGARQILELERRGIELLGGTALIRGLLDQQRP